MGCVESKTAGRSPLAAGPKRGGKALAKESWYESIQGAGISASDSNLGACRQRGASPNRFCCFLFWLEPLFYYIPNKTPAS
jgi:hypothetical protein